MNPVAENLFTISELNQFIRDVVTSGFPRSVWVCGEIQGLRVDQKGHVYFELCEKDESDHTIKARIRASIWSSRRPYIESILKRAENSFELKNEIEVKCLCKVDFYVKGGSLGLVIENIDPVYTLGKIAQERQKLIAQLVKEGILEKNKQLTIPIVSLNIGLVTSQDSAAFNDFKNELQLSGYAFKIFLVSAIVQGKEAEKSVSRAVHLLNRLEGLDAIVITRGGGSVAELSCFDSRLIAEAVAASKVAVLTGIGHEINMTITDLSAHTFAKTPTAIAQFLVGRVQEFLTGLDKKETDIARLVTEKIETQKYKLRDLGRGLQAQTMDYLKSHHTLLTRYSEVLTMKPSMLLKEQDKSLARYKEELLKTIRLRLENNRSRIKSLDKVIEVVSPVNTLKRGFTITRLKDGTILKSSTQVKEKENLVTEFADGKVTSLVSDINRAVI